MFQLTSASAYDPGGMTISGPGRTLTLRQLESATVWLTDAMAGELLSTCRTEPGLTVVMTLPDDETSRRAFPNCER